MIGAVFYRDLFWDGRANHRFNGNDPFGNTANASQPNTVDQENGALASQAVGPPNNEVEMSCSGRVFNGPNSLGAKLLARIPLGKQQVSPADGALGLLSAAPNNGLVVTYQQMIDAAFTPAVASDSEAQLSRIWGQAIQAYEATLIPDDTPFDRYLAGDTSAMTANQIDGWMAFKDPNRADCFGCHAGPELSDATVGFAELNGSLNVDGGDQGFHNIGASPTSDDPGRAGTGPNGASWSVSGSTFDTGAFKTPALRNVKLTAPYMHNGAVGDLDSVMGFYVHNLYKNAEESSQFRDIRLRGADRAAVVDFLMNGLTDCRVEKEQAPFDHPSLPLPNGTALPAVGASGTGACP